MTDTAAPTASAASAAPTSGRVTLRTEGGVAWITFDRPAARNAMTWAMYEQLSAICQQLQQDASVRVAVFRGAGGQAFVAGTDIEQFTAFQSAEDGVAYERQIEAGIAQLCALPMPTVALVEGWCVGGGLAIATACDFRLATPGAKFGVPIARTLGNCLSIQNVARLRAAFGHQRTRRTLRSGRADLRHRLRGHAPALRETHTRPRRHQPGR